MAYIGNIPAEKFTSVDIQNFTVSATANYTLDRPVANENEIELFINNVRQHPGSGKAYTASGTALTLSEATAGTDTMYCVYQGKARQTVTPATSSVTNAMLAGSIDLTSKVTGALPQANIADQAINEAKMQISNAPTNGYMLTAQSGNTGGLTWAEAPSGGAWNLLETETTDSGGSVDLNSFSSSYNVHAMTFDLVRTAVNDDVIKMMVFDGSDNTMQIYYAYQYFKTNESGTTGTGTSGTYSTNPHNVNLFGGLGNGGNEGFSGIMYFTGLTNSTDATLFWGQQQIFRHNDEYSHYLVQGRIANSTISKIRFFGNGGNFAHGTIKLYGLS